MYCTVLYCTVLYCTVLHCVVTCLTGLECWERGGRWLEVAGEDITEKADTGLSEEWEECEE